MRRLKILWNKERAFGDTQVFIFDDLTKINTV